MSNFTNILQFATFFWIRRAISNELIQTANGIRVELDDRKQLTLARPITIDLHLIECDRT